MRKYFVMCDIHSFYDEMQDALKKNNFDIDNENHFLIVCGDLFDRGSKTRDVYEFVKSLGDRFIYVRGNHEDLLEDCIQAIVSGQSISNHHFGNGTIRTIANFCGIDEFEFQRVRLSEEIKSRVYALTRPLLEFIDSKSVNYYKLNNYIFVHGWVPTINPNLSVFDNKPLRLAPIEWWNDQEDYSCRDIWREARWTNGMKAWHDGCIVDGKTVVCGHWHCSYGWSHIDQKRKEFPSKNYANWQKSFEPYIKPGIIALDACTAYSGFCNCIVIDT